MFEIQNHDAKALKMLSMVSEQRVISINYSINYSFTQSINLIVAPTMVPLS